MGVADLSSFVARDFPQVADDIRIRSANMEGVVIVLGASPRHLRPGGTVSGPAMFGLADVAVYLAILSRIGPAALAVTTGASIDFMRKPAAGIDLVATARLLKLGRSLAVGDVLIRPDGAEAPVARASLTYALPRS